MGPDAWFLQSGTSRVQGYLLAVMESLRAAAWQLIYPKVLGPSLLCRTGRSFNIWAENNLI